MPARGGLRSLDGGQERKMSNPIYVYEFYVMDEAWEAFPTISETITKLHEHDTMEDHNLKRFLDFKDRALTAALDAQVKEGYITPIYVMPLINNHEASFSLVWKAAKGGWCVAISEVPLAWLEEIESCTVKVFHDL